MSICSTFVWCLTGVARVPPQHILPQVIINEGEADGAGVVPPETWCCVALVVAMLGESFFK
jgi:hypothetical protein